jgi:hypothetical protein
MAKSTKVTSKKKALTSAPAGEPMQASTPVSAASPAESPQVGAADSVEQVTRGVRVPRSERVAAEGPEEVRARWKRRLARWSWLREVRTSDEGDAVVSF